MTQAIKKGTKVLWKTSGEEDLPGMSGVVEAFEDLPTTRKAVTGFLYGFSGWEITTNELLQLSMDGEHLYWVQVPEVGHSGEDNTCVGFKEGCQCFQPAVLRELEVESGSKA